MRRFLWLVGFLIVCPEPGIADDCSRVISELKLPSKLKTRGKPKRARWEHVNTMMPELRERVDSSACRLKLSDVFAPKNDEIYFPLLGSVIQTMSDTELKGLEIFYLDGSPAGHYSNRVVFEKSNYNQYYFQFTDRRGTLQTSNRNLLDFGTGKPLFLVRWTSIKDKVVSDESKK